MKVQGNGRLVLAGWLGHCWGWGLGHPLLSRAVVGCQGRVGPTADRVLGLDHDAVLNFAIEVASSDVANGGMVESLRGITQGLARSRVPRGGVVIHDS